MPKPPMPSVLLALAGLVPLVVLSVLGAGGVDLFVLVLGLVHAAPFWIGAALLLARRTTPLGNAAAGAAVLAEVALIAWSAAQLDEDAQAGLIFVFFTPLAGAVIAGLATAAAFIAARRPGRAA